MTPQDVQAIHGLLMTRIQPRDVREGVAIAGLAQKLVAHFAAPPPAQPVAPSQPDAQ